MRNRIFLLVGILLSGLILFSACDSTDDTVNPPDEKGSIKVISTPAGADIYLNGTKQTAITPATIANLDPGTYTVKLVLTGYMDTTVTATVVDAQETTVNVALTANMDVVKYGPIRLWETTGTTADQPSGLDLSSGEAYGISAAPNNGFVDIYYSSNGFLVKSAHLATTYSLTRETFFKAGAGTNLEDGVDSPAKDNSWTDNMGDRETKYVFLLDEDGHYSKIKIVDFGGGDPGNPAWVEVEWYFNNTLGDKRF